MKTVFMWIGYFLALAEVGIIIYFTKKEKKVPMIPVCICSALAMTSVILFYAL